jgi:hypothetical protein
MVSFEALFILLFHRKITAPLDYIDWTYANFQPAAKHINGIGRKARIWHILNDVEAHLGYHTRSVGKRLQDLLIDQRS